MDNWEKRSSLPFVIDSRFTENDLDEIFTFDFEKDKKKSATCKVKRNVNGELKRL